MIEYYHLTIYSHTYILILTPYISYRSEKDDLTIEISSNWWLFFAFAYFLLLIQECYHKEN